MSAPTEPTTTYATASDSEDSNDGTGPPSTSQPFAKLTSFEHRFLSISQQFRRLLEIKKEYGRHPAVAQQFESRRQAQLNAPAASSGHSFRIAYENAIWDMSRTRGDCFEGNHGYRILDLGCSPGGFSNWLLENNATAVGVGVTLPDEDAKFKVAFDGTRLNEQRYALVYADVIPLAMKSIVENSNPIASLAGCTLARETAHRDFTTPYDLVIAGAFPTLNVFVSWWYRIQLTLSQVLFAIPNLAPGGAFIMVTKNKPFRWLVELLSIFRRCFTDVSASKGSHKVRSSCYIVCRGYHATDEQRGDTIERLRSALKKLENIEDIPRGLTDDHGHRNERSMSLLFSCSDEELFDQEREFFLGILEPQWDAQYDAIKGSLDKRTWPYLFVRSYCLIFDSSPQKQRVLPRVVVGTPLDLSLGLTLAPSPGLVVVRRTGDLPLRRLPLPAHLPLQRYGVLRADGPVSPHQPLLLIVGAAGRVTQSRLGR